MTHIDPDYIDTFEAYLDGELSSEEFTQFESRLETDSAFRSSFMAYKKLNEALPDAFEAKLRAQLQQTDAAMPPVARTPVRNIRAKRLYWAVGIAAVLIGLIFGVYQLRSEKRIFDAYWQPEPGLPVTMSEEQSWNPAMNAFKQGKWDEAEALLLTLPSDTASYYLGMVAYERGNQQQALKWFDTIPNESEWYAKAEFRKALLLVRTNERNEALKTLQAIPQSEASSALPINALINDLK